VRVSIRRTGDGGLVFCWSDISAFKKVEQVLADELAHERTLAATQRSFVSMASHQFRTPLTVIDINAQLLESRGNMGLATSEVSERTTRIRRTVKRMIGLMETMLGAANAEAGNIVLNRTAVDLKALVHETCARKREIAPERIFEIEVKNLPPSVSCDANIIDQVIDNILSNAVKYSKDNDKIAVTGSTQGNMAVIAVTDFGIGISPRISP
jgi:signal transduction histidine kinase